MGRSDLIADSHGLCQLLSHACLLAVSCILMDNALSSSLVNRGDRFTHLSTSGSGVFKRSIELLDGSTHAILDHPVLQRLLFTDLHTLLGGLDIRQLIHLPIVPGDSRHRGSS